MSARESSEQKSHLYFVIGYRLHEGLAKYSAVATQQANAGDACRNCSGENFHVVAVVRPDENAPGGLAFPVMCHTKHESSPQPHVAAGEGWRERMHKAICAFGDASFSDGFQNRSFPGRDFERAREAIDALIAEVVELPEPSKFIVTVTIDENGYECAEIADAMFPKHPVMRVLKNQATDLAAALIRAATSAEDKASQ